jgi:hypothetical protein
MSNSALTNIRLFYGVPALRGAQVKFQGVEHTILSGDGHHLYLRDPNGNRVGPCHPTWEMDYGDGRDYGAEMDDRIRRFNELISQALRTVDA